MRKSEVIGRLLALPAAIAVAEETLLSTEERRRVAQDALQQAEDELLLDADRINGKNAEQRAAQVRQETRLEREMVTAMEYRVGEARIGLRLLTNELASLKATARLLAGTNE